MVTAAQIVVAAALALAWVWVLWKPVVHGLLGLFGRRRFDPFAIDQSHHVPSELEAAFWGEEPRNARPPEIRRRQLMLATLLAWFISFFLAIAFRGLLVWLFGLMTVLVVVHVSIAAYLGGRIIRARDARHDVAHQREALAIATYRATRVEADVVVPSEMHLLVQELQAQVPAGGGAEWRVLVEELIEQAWGPDEPAQPVAEVPAAEVVPPTESAEAPSPARPAADRRRRAPAAEAQPEAAPVTPAADAAPEPAARPAPRPPADLSPQPQPRHRPTPKRAEPAAAESDPLFTRPAGQAPKPRRAKPRPIYIHSQLDEEGFLPPRAVNDQ